MSAKPTPSTLADWQDYASLASGSEAGERPKEPSPAIATVHVGRVSVQGPGMTPERVRRIMLGEERV